MNTLWKEKGRRGKERDGKERKRKGRAGGEGEGKRERKGKERNRRVGMKGWDGKGRKWN